jgi:exosortase/archaeosortase family protein
MAGLFLLMFPTRWTQKVLLPLIAVGIGFVLNGFRVALLAVVVNDQAAFKYWHDGGGSLIFSAVGVGLLGLVCLYLLQQNQQLEEEEQ